VHGAQAKSEIVNQQEQTRVKKKDARTIREKKMRAKPMTLATRVDAQEASALKGT